MEEITQSWDAAVMEELDKALESLSKLRRWLLCIFLLCCIPGIFNAWHILVSNFYAYTPPHWCQVPELSNANWSTEQIQTISMPNPDSATSCTLIRWNYTHLVELGYEAAIKYTNSSPRPEEIPCDKFSFEDKEPFGSVVSEWNLVCDNRIGKTNVQGSIAIGKLFGGFLFGFIADRFGRKISFVLSCTIYMIFGPLAAFSPTFWCFIATRFMIGVAGSGAYETGFTILAELVSTKWRTILGCIYNCSYPVGYMSLAIGSLAFSSWRTLQLGVSLPMFILIINCWYIPESPRWLISQGLIDKAWKIIGKVDKRLMPTNVDQYIEALDIAFNSISRQLQQLQATVYIDFKNEIIPYNLKKVETTILCLLLLLVTVRFLDFSFLRKNTEDAERQKISVCNKMFGMFRKLCILLSSGELIKRILLCYFAWFVASLMYYVLALNSFNFGTEQHVYTFLSGLVEIPGYLLPILIMLFIGRKPTTAMLFFISGATLVAIPAIPKEETNLILGLALLGRFADVAVFGVVVVYTSELFPTTIRNTAVGGSLAISQLGSISAPYIVDLMSDFGWYVPTTLCGSAALVCSVLTLLLPETRDRSLQQTVDELKESEDQVSIFNCCKFS